MENDACAAEAEAGVDAAEEWLSGEDVPLNREGFEPRAPNRAESEEADGRMEENTGRGVDLGSSCDLVREVVRALADAEDDAEDVADDEAGPNVRPLLVLIRPLRTRLEERDATALLGLVVDEEVEEAKVGTLDRELRAFPKVKVFLVSLWLRRWPGCKAD